MRAVADGGCVHKTTRQHVGASPRTLMQPAVGLDVYCSLMASNVRKLKEKVVLSKGSGEVSKNECWRRRPPCGFVAASQEPEQCRGRRLAGPPQLSSSERVPRSRRPASSLAPPALSWDAVTRSRWQSRRLLARQTWACVREAHGVGRQAIKSRHWRRQKTGNQRRAVCCTFSTVNRNT